MPVLKYVDNRQSTCRMLNFTFTFQLQGAFYFQKFLIRNSHSLILKIGRNKSLEAHFWWRTQGLTRKQGYVKMSASETKDHLTRTADSTRQKVITAATVERVRDESATVKGLDVKIHNPEFSFKAGQWVDTFIPGVKEMTGFSMCSSPGLLKSENILRLAVKASPHPPATWVHTKCSVGDKLDLRVGGDYFYDPEVIATPHNLLLVAGGVGINPLMSMLELVDGIPAGSGSCRPDKVHLMFSAKSDDEILFKERINEICENNPNITAQFFITAEAQGERKDNSVYGRIKEQHIQAAVTNLKCSRLACHLCGPSPMIDNIEKMLENNGITKSDIHYERWW